MLSVVVVGAAAAVAVAVAAADVAAGNLLLFHLFIHSTLDPSSMCYCLVIVIVIAWIRTCYFYSSGSSCC